MSASEAYAKKIEARLDELDVGIDRMKAKAKGADAEAQLEYTRQLSGLREKRDAAGRKFDALRAAGDEALDEVRADMENAWKELKAAVDTAQSRFDQAGK
jgi:DNA repair exonuclease SbcCD ATPase subunit